MIDLTPLDVRNKKGDFAKSLRGYDPAEVDTFLDLVAERLETLVRENMTLRERSERLLEQVSTQEGREKAVQEALVTAQELRKEVRDQAQREADLIRQEAEGEAHRIIVDANRQVKQRREVLEELERKRLRFLRSFRALLERELDVVEVEEERQPLEEVEVELDLGGGGLTAGDVPVHELAEAVDRLEFTPAREPRNPPADSLPELEEHEPAAPEPGAEALPEADRSPALDEPEVAGRLEPAGESAEEPGPAPAEEDEDAVWLSSVFPDERDEESRG